LPGGLCGRQRGWIMFVALRKGDRVRVVHQIFLDFENPLFVACNSVLKLGRRSMLGHGAVGHSCFILPGTVPRVYHIAHIVPFAFGQCKRFITS
jgi:hypothetical protein